MSRRMQSARTRGTLHAVRLGCDQRLALKPFCFQLARSVGASDAYELDTCNSSFDVDALLFERLSHV